MNTRIFESPPRSRGYARIALIGAMLLVSQPARTACEAIEPAIASGHPLAVAAGHEILAAGGNAFDAAIAVTAALAVVEPYNSGLGGGGFYLLQPRGLSARMLDARETAPAAASARMYRSHPEKSLDGALAAGIPGVPAALDHLARHYGKLPLAQSLAPAIRHAENGFATNAQYARFVGWRRAALIADPLAARQFLHDADAPKPGYVLRQPALANTLKTLAERGAAGFYSGPVGAELVRSVRAGGGIWTPADLDAYRVVERTPQVINYRGVTLTTASLPSSGGLTLAQGFNLLAALPTPVDATERAHFLAEALRRAYQDRARYLGDPAFATPPAELATADYARARAQVIRRDAATPSAKLGVAMPSATEAQQTTHFSLVDRWGNTVSATLSINGPFGAAVVAGATGVLLNNEMDDFVSAPGVPNLYGLVGGDANAIAPGKRPLSSMSPSRVDDARGTLIVGSPGGSRIISQLMLAVLDYVEHPEVDVAHLVARPRIHHQYLPDQLEMEAGALGAETVAKLRALGHTIVLNENGWGDMQAVFVDAVTCKSRAASDPRGQ